MINPNREDRSLLMNFVNFSMWGPLIRCLVLLCHKAFEPVTPNVTRRSARLSMKGRSLFEAIDKEMEPKTPVKKARKSRHNGTANKDECEFLIVF